MERSEAKLSKRTVLPVVLFILALAVFNIAFIASNGWSRLIWNILGYACLLIAFQKSHLNLQSIGLSKANARQGLKYASYVIAAILAFMLIAFLIDDTAFKDPRYRHSLSTALYSAMVLLPLKTVLFEEIAFRGILPAMLLKIKNERRFASFISAGAFGLWHIFSATVIGDYTLGGIVVPNILVVLVVFIATSIFGYLMLELRWRSKSLVAPIAVHWFLNGFGMILASLSWS